MRRKVAGTTAEALAMAESARFLLRRSARGRPYAPGDLGDRLEQVLLGDAVRLLPDGPVVVVPTARLHGVPWALLPALAGPAVRRWSRRPPSGCGPRDAGRRRRQRVALLAGPGLGTGGAEVPVLARRQPDADPPGRGGRDRRGRAGTRSTARGWRTSRPTAGSARTARSSPRSSWPTAR